MSNPSLTRLYKALGSAGIAATLFVLSPVAIYSAVSSALPNDKPNADLMVVYTGNNGRVRQALKTFKENCQHTKQWLLISGVYKKTSLSTLTEANDIALPSACQSRVLTGSFARNTAANALETRNAIQLLKQKFDYDVQSIRLMTSQCHMPRAYSETKEALDDDVSIHTKAISHCGSTYLTTAYSIVGEPIALSKSIISPLNNDGYSVKGKWTVGGKEIPKTLPRPSTLDYLPLS